MYLIYYVTLVTVPIDILLSIFEVLYPMASPAFSAMSGYGSLTWGSLNSSNISESISQHKPSLEPI